MAAIAEHPEWGLSFPHYTYTCQSRLEAAFLRYMSKEEVTVQLSRDLIPLAFLETTLAIGENMHILGFQTGDEIFPKLMHAMRVYTAVTEGGVFDHYYGFLCIRHLIRMMCAETLTKSGVFHELLGHFPRDTPGDLVMESLSNAALLYMELTLRDRIEASADPQLALFSGSLFIEDGLLSSRDAKFLIGLLWKSRSSIIPLRSEELLPGLTVLMLVLSQLTSVHVPVQQLDPQWLRIQDISLRCYLACLVIPQGIETTKERYILQRINQHIFELFSNLEIWTTYDVWFYVDENDARTVVKMYANLIGPYPETPLVLCFTITRWVFLSLRNPNTRRPGFDNLVPRVLPTSLGFLQKEIDKDLVNPIPEGTRETIRLITRAMFEMIGMFSASTPPPTIEVQDAILEALLQSDLYGIIGRIIMFITRETEVPSSWHPFLNVTSILGEIMGGHEKLPLVHTVTTTHEWTKLFFHLMYRISDSAFSSRPDRLLEDAQRAWICLIRQSSLKRVLSGLTYTCAYPRCAYPQAVIYTHETNHICGGCGVAKYCSIWCQIMHWWVNTADSHSRACRFKLIAG